MASFQRGHDARYPIETEAGVHHQARKSQKEEKLAMACANKEICINLRVLYQ